MLVAQLKNTPNHNLNTEQSLRGRNSVMDGKKENSDSPEAH